jgi:hypothetical protein
LPRTPAVTTVFRFLLPQVPAQIPTPQQ